MIQQLFTKKIWLVSMFILGSGLMAEAQVVSSFTLVNADTDKDIGPLSQGSIINLAILPTSNLNIRVNTSPSTVGSVTFNLNNGSITRVESAAPYALAGDDNGNYRPWSPALGAYTLKAKAFSLAGAKGTSGAEITLNFTVVRETTMSLSPPSNLVANALNANSIQLTWVDNANNEDNYILETASSAGGAFSQLVSLGVNTTQYTHTGLNPGQSVWYRVKVSKATLSSSYSNTATATTPNTVFKPSVISLSLINASNNQVITQLSDGQQLNIATLPSTNLSIQANTDGGESVRMILSGALSQNLLDNEAPYSLFGDIPNPGGGTIFTGRTFPAGNYTISATPYTLDNAGGITGNSLSLNFSLINSTPTNYNLVLTNDGNGSASVSPVATTYPIGTSLTLTAAPNAGYAFSNWTNSTGTVISAANPYTFTINNNQNLRANFSPVPSGPAVVSFTLVNAVNEQDILVLQHGASIDINSLPTKQLNIRANNSGAVESVHIELSGALTKTILENNPPYALYGDINGDYNAQTFIAGQYTLSGTPYTKDNATGTTGTALNITFNLTNTPPVVNNPPVLTNPGNQSHTEEQNLSLSITANDGDASLVQTLTFAASGLPEGLTINAQSGLISGLIKGSLIGIPGAASNSPYNTTITVTDNGNPSLSTSISFTWIILENTSNTVTAPSNLIAQALSTDQIQLNWQDNSGNETGFVLESAPSIGGTFTELVILPTNSTQYIHTTLNPGQTRAYRIKARNATKESAYSNTAQAQTFSSPLAPQNLNVSQISFQSVLLSWTGSSFGESYQLEQSNQPNTGFSPINTVSWGTNQFLVSGLNLNTSYYFRVVTLYKGLISAPSNVVQASTSNLTVQSFTLINADNNVELGLLQDGAIINLALLTTNRLSIRANTNPDAVGSVRFGYDSDPNYRTENNTPYAIQGFSNGNYNPWTPSLGQHQLSAIPFTDPNASGTSGSTFSINFQVIDVPQNSDPIISGEMKKWHKITISFFGPESSEQDTDNPFLNYRLHVTFQKGNKTYVVPGYYAADGQAGETGATSGNLWKVHFSPDETGTWSYTASFRKGNNIAVDENPNAGEATSFDGKQGTFNIIDSDKRGRDFRAKGRLNYVDRHYLRFKDNGEYFLKGGADSPENFLAYQEFDSTYSHGGTDYTKTYSAHIKHWDENSPVWKNDKGKGIIGALNYLASKGMNAVYFLTMNVNGDGKDVWPWTTHTERYRFDVSKLDQWEVVFSHMDKLGIMMHIVLQETENDLLLDAGSLGIQRKLYYREMIARFSHHLAISWNLGEENNYFEKIPDPNNNQLKNHASYLKDHDPYQSYINVHTYPNHQEDVYSDLIGYRDFNGTSLQVFTPQEVHNEILKWLQRSKQSGHPWVVNMDEAGPPDQGVVPDANDFWHDNNRKYSLWGSLMSGA
ncbi:MAG: DUF5060 domain-containing protein [Microscillaceae bacterium]|nr:DUF5060 domain-containing protein [Microscillaceae bacterium]